MLDDTVSMTKKKTKKTEAKNMISNLCPHNEMVMAMMIMMMQM